MSLALTRPKKASFMCCYYCCFVLPSFVCVCITSWNRERQREREKCRHTHFTITTENTVVEREQKRMLTWFQRRCTKHNCLIMWLFCTEFLFSVHTYVRCCTVVYCCFFFIFFLFCLLAWLRSHTYTRVDWQFHLSFTFEFDDDDILFSFNFIWFGTFGMCVSCVRNEIRTVFKQTRAFLFLSMRYDILIRLTLYKMMGSVEIVLSTRNSNSFFFNLKSVVESAHAHEQL